jgi:FkbM family methyltransferase
VKALIRRGLAAMHGLRAVDRILRQVAAAPIVDAGVDHEGDPWIRLEDGLKLFGYRPLGRFASAYPLLARRTRAVLPRACLQVAADYVVRFEGGALRFGGPVKQKHYRVRAGDTAVEMGGYLGAYALRLSREVGPTGRVVAIEPNPGNVRLLRKNRAANRADHVTVVDKGVWREPSTLTFTVDGDDMQSGSLHLEGGRRRGIEVAVDSLDHILAEARVKSVDFMVIQLNGAELEALRGLTSVRPRHLAIAARYPLADGGNAAHAIAAELGRRGYETTIEEDSFVFARLVSDWPLAGRLAVA